MSTGFTSRCSETCLRADKVAAFVRARLTSASERLSRRVRQSRSGHFSRFGEDEILAEQLHRLDGLDSICVDIGAGDGVAFSNTYRLFNEGWGGLAIEGEPRLFAALAKRYSRFRKVRLARVWVTPENIESLLLAAGIPSDVSVVSLDIDGYDYFVLKALLERYRPKLVMVEINEKIPPPVKFSVRWDPGYTWAGDHFYGMSICTLDELCKERGYSLIALEYNNALLAPVEIAATSVSAAEAYRIGYLQRPDRTRKLPWNRDVEYLQQLSDEEKVAAIDTYFAKYRGAFVCSL